MPLGIEFIGQNPAIKGFNEARQQQRVQQGSDDLATLRRFQIEELGLTRDTNKAIDKVLRDAVLDKTPKAPLGAAKGPGPQEPTGASALSQASRAASQAGGGAPAAPQGPGASLAGFGGVQDRVIQGLAGVEGGGQRAFEMAQSRNTAASAKAVKALERYFEALKTGDMDQATLRVFGKFAGVEVPDEILQNAQQRQQLAVAGQWLKLFGSDLLSFGQFFGYATKNATDRGPDWQGAFQKFPPTNQAQAAPRAGRDPRAFFQRLYNSAIMTGYAPEEANEIATAGVESAAKLGGAGPSEAVSGLRVGGESGPAGAEGAQGPAQSAPPGLGVAGAPGAPGQLAPAQFPETAGIPGIPGIPAIPGAAIEVPQNPDGTVNIGELVPSQVYNTSRGLATWDGQQFFPVQ